MFGFAPLLLLLTAAIPTKATGNRVKSMHARPTMIHHGANSTILGFDDIPTITGLATVPSPYSHFDFSSYNVITPRDPSLVGKISPHDLNCALSPPNALIGSRDLSNPVNGPIKASFKIANATAMTEHGLFPYFDLLTFYIKPMDAPPPGTTIWVKGYSHSRKEPLEWDVDFITGYHLPLLVKLQQYTGEAWEQLYRVEIWADYGDDALDWEFCVDDLEVRLHEMTKVKGGEGAAEQVVLVEKVEV